MVRGFAREGISWLEAALASTGDSPSAARARAANWTLGRMHSLQGDVARARSMLNEALRLARDIEMKSLLSGLLVTLGDFALAERDWHTAVDWYRQGLRASVLLATPGTMAHAL